MRARPPANLTHPDKVFWPKEGFTKLDLARYYQSVFPKLKPWVAGRLLTMERCPDGMRGQCFYQKEAPPGLPPGTPTKAIRHTHKVTRYVVGGRLSTQLALVNSLDEHGRRGAFEKEFLIGPSLQIRPLPQMHIDFAPLFGTTKASPRAKVFVVLGWEF